jgi:hypothetical protein
MITDVPRVEDPIEPVLSVDVGRVMSI